MHLFCAFRLAPAFLAAGLFIVSSTATTEAADEWGTVTGQFILKKSDPIPEPKFLVKEGQQLKKNENPEICSARDIPDESLLIDTKSRGIANVFFYKLTAKKIHPDLKSTPEDKKKVVFDQKGCRFIPHAMVLRTDQTVIVKSGDNCPHNTRTISFRNRGENFVVAANDRVGQHINLKRREKLPVVVKCDYHKWMSARWLLLDHPYGAKTDKEGRFSIEKLPVGEHVFVIYHERSGWINRKGLKVTVKKGMNKLDVTEVPLDKFRDE